MSKTKHTPGPWLFGRNLSEITGADGVTHVADIYTQEDDAYLVKASPELLEAADAMLSALADYFLDCGLDVLAERLRRHASVPTVSKADVIEGLKIAGDNLAEVMRKAKGQ